MEVLQSGAELEVVLEENVTGIGQAAFYACSRLTSVTVPHSAVVAANTFDSTVTVEWAD